MHSLHLINVLLAELYKTSDVLSSLRTQTRVLFNASHAFAQCPFGRAFTKLQTFYLPSMPPLHSLTSKVLNNLKASPLSQWIPLVFPPSTSLSKLRRIQKCTLCTGLQNPQCSIMQPLAWSLKEIDWNQRTQQTRKYVYNLQMQTHTHLQHIINTWRHSSTNTE